MFIHKIVSTIYLIGGLAFNANAKSPEVEVWKNPNCGCCNAWIDHMQHSGFKVKVNNTGNHQIREQLGIKEEYASCHTAVVNGYAIEGHVPAEDAKRLLAEKPNAIGLAAPGMPIGSPGMDTPAYQGHQEPYDVLLLKKTGESERFQAH